MEKNDDESRCIFCLEAIPDSDNNKVVERACYCQYSCHSRCLNTWRQTENNSCAICRKNAGATAPHLEEIEVANLQPISEERIATLRIYELCCISILVIFLIAGSIGIYYIYHPKS
jgi:hypothetical protein